MKMVVKKNARGEIEQTFEPGKESAKKSWKQILQEAPIGTQVIWTDEDAKKKCAADPDLSFCEAWINENATKIGPDRSNAFPLGEKDEASVKREMATIIYRTDMSAPAAAPQRH